MIPATAAEIARDKFVEGAGALLLDRPAAPAFDLDAAIARACSRIAPLWPLDSFVAVNPFLGYADMRFEEARAALRRRADVRMLMPRAFYRAALASGRIGDLDLRDAIAATGAAHTPDTLRAALQDDEAEASSAAATFADVVYAVAGTTWSALATAEIAK
jgi:hypothetical protein